MKSSRLTEDVQTGAVSAPGESETATSGKTLILCDFDGTVSVRDTVKKLISDHVVSPDWEKYVEMYRRGELGSKGVYEAVGPLMRMNEGDLHRFVDAHAALDPAFPDFLRWAQARGMDVKIVSDGFDATIKTLFAKHGVDGPEIFSNSLIMSENGAVTLASPHADPSCGRCGTCKPAIIRRFRDSYDKIVLVGDGVSDRHAAAEADLVLALEPLFIYCARKGIPAVRVSDFSEIPALLERRIRGVLFDMDGTLLDSSESIAEAFNHMFTELGYPNMTLEEVVRKTSVSLLDFVKGFLKPEHFEEGLRIFKDYYITIFKERTSLMPGAMETIKTLNGSVIQGIVTNKRGIAARALADHFGFMDDMAVIMGAQDGFKAKPAADMFLEVMRRKGLEKHSTVYVGDAVIDIEAANNTGIDAFVIEGPIFSAEELASHGPRVVLRDILQLPAALKPLI